MGRGRPADLRAYLDLGSIERTNGSLLLRHCLLVRRDAQSLGFTSFARFEALPREMWMKLFSSPSGSPPVLVGKI